MNTIQITDKYWITSNNLSWMISEYRGKQINKRTQKEQDIWVHASYHPTFEKAVVSLSQRLLREASTANISELRDEARRIEAILKSASEKISDGLELNIRKN